GRRDHRQREHHGQHQNRTDNSAQSGTIKSCQAAHTQRGQPRNAGQHRAQIQHQPRVVAGGEPRRHSEKTQGRPGAEPACALTTMPARLTFLGIVAFWLTMNVLLWRAEFGARGGDTPVPVQLVWRKILTAPDASSLSVYQAGDRMGYCEFSTGVGQQMATFDEDKPPPEGIGTRGGYQIHLAGNVALGDFTNRLKFDGRVQFTPAHQWQELNLKITSRLALIEIRSLATNQLAHVKFSNDGMPVLERDFTFADLQNPGALVRALTGNFTDGWFGGFDLPELVPAAAAQN